MLYVFLKIHPLLSILVFEGPSVENSQALEGRGKGKMLAMKTVILKQVPSKLMFV